MKNFILLLPLIFIASCSPEKCPFSAYPVEDKDAYKEGEATLQSAEDAMTKQFNDHSFDR